MNSVLNIYDSIIGDNSIKISKKYNVNETIVYSQIQNLSKEKVVLKYFKSLIKRWEYDLKIRDENVKLSAKGLL